MLRLILKNAVNRREIIRMKKILTALAAITCICLINSCKTTTPPVTKSTNGTIKQDESGIISLNIDNADTYADMDDRSDNTAEWNVVVSKSGRYNVWITSETMDTTDLRYKNPVLINVQDKMLQARPDCDRIVVNSSDVQKPYFRADSFIGSLYLQDTGQFYIQVTSEMIIPKDVDVSESTASDIARLISVSFMPATR